MIDEAWAWIWEYRGPREEQPWYLRRAESPQLRAAGLIMIVMGIIEFGVGVAMLT